MSRFLLIFFFITAGNLFAQGKLGTIVAPAEIPAGEEFSILVSASALQRTVLRAIVIEIPENVKLVKALAVDEEGEDTISLDPYPSIVSMFTKEKGRRITAFSDRSGIYSANYSAVGYLFTFIAPKTASSIIFKTCLVERGDPSVTTEIPPAKGKPKKKKTPVMGTDWRIVAPDFVDKFSFAEMGGTQYSKTVRSVSGWNKTSRALVLDGRSTAVLHCDSTLVGDLFAAPFTVNFWYSSTALKQSVLRWHNRVKDSMISLKVNALGSVELQLPSERLRAFAFVSDGAWHQISVTKDITNSILLRIDGEVQDSIVISDQFVGIDHFCIGDPKVYSSFALDEFSVLEYSGEQPSTTPIAMRNTAAGLFALFHFEDFGQVARSSIFPRRKVVQDTTIPIRNISLYFELDSNASMQESSSPVLPDRALLTVEQSSATKVTFTWIATSEYGVKRYQLQRRIGSFGDYEKTLEIKAKQPISIISHEQGMLGRASYSAVENLPVISKDIELYYRLAIIGDNDSVMTYTEPVKLEYGGARDVFVDQNKPNPFNPKTTITLRMIRTAPVTIKIYDIMGLEMTTLYDGKLSAGKHSIDVDASKWPAGIYYYKVKTARTIVTKKMVLAK